MSLPQGEINWDNLDKTRFFFVGAGLFSGVSSMLYPMTVVKTRMQVLSKSKERSPTAIQTFRSIIRNEGFRGLYRGFPTVIVGTIPGRTVYLSSLEMTKSAALKVLNASGFDETTAAGLSSGVAGMSASLMTQVVAVPIDVVSQRLMVQGSQPGQPQYKGGLDAFRSILRTQGIRGLYRGFGMSIVTYAPSSACWWSSYGVVQRLIWRQLDAQGLLELGRPPSQWTVVAVQGLSGCCAGGMSALLTTPLDTVKTRLQVLEREGGARPTIRWTIEKLVREEGLRGFYKGLGPRWASTSLWGTAMITTYEFLKRLSAKGDL